MRRKSPMPFMITPSAMAQRLAAAKARIKSEGLRFEEPAPQELPERVAPILEGIYGAYTIGSNAAAPLADEGAQLRPEAEFLRGWWSRCCPTAPSAGCWR
jgi:RNA polymerase sigma-70 factor (ECF subfamily)